MTRPGGEGMGVGWMIRPVMKVCVLFINIFTKKKRYKFKEFWGARPPSLNSMPPLGRFSDGQAIAKKETNLVNSDFITCLSEKKSKLSLKYLCSSPNPALRGSVYC